MSIILAILADQHVQGLLAALTLWAVTGAVGAILPKDSRAGQIVRAWAADWFNKNLKTMPPAKPGEPVEATINKAVAEIVERDVNAKGGQS